MCTQSMYHWAIRLGCVIVFLACSVISGMALEDETVSRKATEDTGVKDAQVKKATEKGKKVREEAQGALKKGARKVQEGGKKVLEGGKAAARAVDTKAKAVKDKVKAASKKVKDRGRKIIDDAKKNLKKQGEKQGATGGDQAPEHDGPADAPKPGKP